jgi:hypothetical protein
VTKADRLRIVRGAVLFALDNLPLDTPIRAEKVFVLSTYAYDLRTTIRMLDPDPELVE